MRVELEKSTHVNGRFFLSEREMIIIIILVKWTEGKRGSTGTSAWAIAVTQPRNINLEK